MILTCRNCGFAITPAMLARDDIQSAVATCAHCTETYRITIVLLHQGKPISPEVKSKYGETYDGSGNRIALGSKRPVAPNQTKPWTQDTPAPDGAK